MKEAIATDDAPRAIGPYSQAVRAGDWVFCSGQIALEPQSGDLVRGTLAPEAQGGATALRADAVVAEAERVMENLRAVLSAAGCSFADVVRSTIYLTDLAHYAAVNEVYARYFQAPFPSRVTIQVAALPRGAGVEIDAIALKPR